MTSSELSLSARHATELLSLAEAAKLVPAVLGDPDTPPPSRITVWSWVVDGLLTASGQRVRLNATRIGRHYAVTRKALATWLKQVNEGRRTRAVYGVRREVAPCA